MKKTKVVSVKKKKQKEEIVITEEVTEELRVIGPCTNEGSREDRLTTIGDLLEIWQIRLRLFDWDMSIDITDDIPPNRFGDCQFITLEKKAHINIRESKPGCCDAQRGVLSTPSDEEILVHELLHIVLAPLMPDLKNSGEVDSLEETIFHLTKILYNGISRDE